ncbi:Hypothetical predicted protein [Octopus vulgaris]|uniref:Uncharacterized protein n=1 Tax=Octopus vulgaris TaxID=6645 RepID=A0AA36B3F0_OCTVU|nr:Hypothetical predicted protein [Octopus vulgaris]
MTLMMGSRESGRKCKASENRILSDKDARKIRTWNTQTPYQTGKAARRLRASWKIVGHLEYIFWIGFIRILFSLNKAIGNLDLSCLLVYYQFLHLVDKSGVCLECENEEEAMICGFLKQEAVYQDFVLSPDGHECPGKQCKNITNLFLTLNTL